MVGQDQHTDTHSVIDHKQPHCNSHQLYKGILDGNGRAVFNGKIFVREGAQKTDAMQTNKNLLLSDKARVDTKPQLEIFADRSGGIVLPRDARHHAGAWPESTDVWFRRRSDWQDQARVD
jgi:hypothetical protein